MYMLGHIKSSELTIRKKQLGYRHKTYSFIILLLKEFRLILKFIKSCKKRVSLQKIQDICFGSLLLCHKFCQPNETNNYVNYAIYRTI